MVVLASLLRSGHAPKLLPSPILTKSVSLPLTSAVSPLPLKSLTTHHLFQNHPAIPGCSVCDSGMQTRLTVDFNGVCLGSMPISVGKSSAQLAIARRFVEHLRYP